MITQKETEPHINKFYNDVIKRTADFLLALFGLIITSPLIILVSILIKISSPGSVFYRGIRCGYHYKPFRIFKFRSMVENAENLGGGTTGLNDPRITKIGNILRKTKLDEFPQLFNILTGEMSFIGPRPELLQYTNAYKGPERLILEVRPGITDLSSLEFISLDEIVGSEDADAQYEKLVLTRKIQLRLEYVHKQSIWLDIKLFLLTVAGVFNKIARVFKRR